jgi:hypothetical protein
LCAWTTARNTPPIIFLNQVKFCGIAPSFAFVAEPQTNGVADRFNRTLKEQVIHGRLFRNLEEVRAAVTAFRDRYNRHWRLETECQRYWTHTVLRFDKARLGLPGHLSPGWTRCGDCAKSLGVGRLNQRFLRL